MESAEKAYAAFPSDDRDFSDGKQQPQDPSWRSEKDLGITVERPRMQRKKALPRRLQDPSSCPGSSSGCKPQGSRRTGAESGYGDLGEGSVLQPTHCLYPWHTRQPGTDSHSPGKCLRLSHSRFRAERGREPRSSGCSLPLWALEHQSAFPPSLRKPRTQNRAAGTLAGSQRARAQPRCFWCEVPAGLGGSPRGSRFLLPGRGGWLPPHPTAARPTRAAPHPAATPQPPHRFCLAPGMRRARQCRSDGTYGG